MVKVTERVRFVETDMMGVVHHANYFRWFEIGRVEYLRQAGLSLIEIMDAGYLFPVADVRCKYNNPVRFPDDIIIYAEMRELSRAKMIFSYKIMREDTFIAEGFSANIFTNLKGKVARLPKDIYNKLESFYKNNKMESSIL